MMRFIPLLLLAPVISYAASLDDIIPDVERAAAHPSVVEAVKQQNAKSITLDEIKKIDALWQSTPESETLPVMKAVQENAAVTYLKEVELSKPYYIEAILTDNQGANVATTHRTSDYWQGDEPKFEKAWQGGKGNVFIAKPKTDDSTKEVLSQVSVPVKDGSTVIGTLTLGVAVNKLQ